MIRRRKGTFYWEPTESDQLFEHTSRAAHSNGLAKLRLDRCLMLSWSEMSLEHLSKRIVRGDQIAALQNVTEKLCSYGSSA